MKTHLDWLELTNNAANPTDTDSTRRGLCFVGTTLKKWSGSAWSNVEGGAGGDITSVVAGAGLTGGGTEGDVTLNVVNTDGKITVGANSIDITAGSLVNADINTTANIAVSKLVLATGNIMVGAANVGSAVNAKTDKYILVGDGTTLNSVAVSGVITLSNAGATAFAAGAVVNADVNASAAIVESKLAFSATGGHSHNGVNSTLVSVGTANNLAQTGSLEGGANDLAWSFASQTSAGTVNIRDLNLAAGNDYFVFEAFVQTLGSKVLKTSCYFGDSAAPTKMVKIDASGATATKATTLTFVHTVDRAVTFPDAAGEVSLLGNAVQGSGSVVLATSPTLTTPDIGVATATSINKVAFTAPATGSTLVIEEGKTLTVSKTIQFTSAGDNGVITLPNAAATLVATSDNLSVFAATTSAQLKGIISDETGSGALVFGTAPALATPVVNGVMMAYAAKSADYALLATDYAVYVDTTAASKTITLPAIAAGNLGQVYVVKKKVAGNNLVIARTGADTIDGAGSDVTLTGAQDYRMVMSDGVSNWMIISA